MIMVGFTTSCLSLSHCAISPHPHSPPTPSLSGEVEKDSRSDSEGESTVDEQLTMESETEGGETEDDLTTTTKCNTFREVNSNVVKTNGNAKLHAGGGDCCGEE